VLWFNIVALNSMGMNKLSLTYTITLVVSSLLVLLASNGLSPPHVILIMSTPAAIVGIAGNVMLNRRLRQTNLAHYLGLMPPALATCAMSAATLLVNYELKEWNTLPRLSVCIAVGGASYVGWLVVFHRRWFMSCVQLLISRRAKPT
jgi:hypothetical protein